MAQQAFDNIVGSEGIIKLVYETYDAQYDIEESGVKNNMNMIR